MTTMTKIYARQLLNWIAVTGPMCVTRDPAALPFLDVGAINALCDIAGMDRMPSAEEALRDRTAPTFPDDYEV